MRYLENIKVQLGLLIIAQVICLLCLNYAKINMINIVPFVIIVLINGMLLLWVVYRLSKNRLDQNIDLNRILGVDAKEAMILAKMGIVIFDEQYYITWISDLLAQRYPHIVGKKVGAWFNDLAPLVNGEQQLVTIKDSDYVYEISRKENAGVLFVKDITNYYQASQKLKDDGLVIGLIQLDNYLEIQQYEDESKMTQINSVVRQPIVEWASRNEMLIRRIRSDRFLVVLTEKQFRSVMGDKFQILNTVKKSSESIDVAITLSMAFAYGTNDFALLDTMVNDLLELAQSRGGDQIAIKRFGENVKFFGGNSEAKEKRSKVRVRVMNQAILETIHSSQKVFVVGHKDMDFDCMGAALCISAIARNIGKECLIVSKSGGIESQLNDALLEYEDVLSSRYRFISDEEGATLINDKDLIVVVDHNNESQCGAPLTLAKATRTIIIDHHRRGECFISNPLLTYIETSASSTCELMCEFIQYQTKFTLPIEEATLMYAGILVDSNHFRARTGSRTFEAAAYLRKIGVDCNVAENMLKETYLDFAAKSKVVNCAIPIADKMLVVPYDDEQIINRTLMSQAADTLLDIKGMEASFVIARINSNDVAISARSKGVVNVQVILEKMNGGGHFSAAGLQRSDSSVSELYEELKACIEQYMQEIKEEYGHESNNVE